jgi:OmpA-OmpF porin, OOP family
MKTVFFILLILTGFYGSAQDYVIKNGEVIIGKLVQFKPGSAELTQESDEALLIIKKYLADKNYISLLRIENHMDQNAGETVISNEAANQKLTEQRSLAVCRRLIGLGVDCRRLLPVGFGSSKPIAENSTSEGRALNRRTCFVNAALKDRPIGGLPVDGGGIVAGNSCL